jgi:hypothetical protein
MWCIGRSCHTQCQQQCSANLFDHKQQPGPLHPDPKFIDLFATAEVFGTRFLEGQNAIGDFFELKPLLPILTGSVQHDSPFLAVPFMNKHSLTGVVVLAGRKNGYPTDWQRSAATLFSSLHVAPDALPKSETTIHRETQPESSPKPVAQHSSP